jgi:Na+/serine symporter
MQTIYNAGVFVILIFAVVFYMMWKVSRESRLALEKAKLDAETATLIEAIKHGLVQKVVTRPLESDALMGRSKYETVLAWVTPGPEAASPNLTYTAREKSAETKPAVKPVIEMSPLIANMLKNGTLNTQALCKIVNGMLEDAYTVKLKE